MVGNNRHWTEAGQLTDMYGTCVWFAVSWSLVSTDNRTPTSDLLMANQKRFQIVFFPRNYFSFFPELINFSFRDYHT